MNDPTFQINKYTEIATRLAQQTNNQYDVSQILIFLDRYARTGNDINTYTFEQLVSDATDYVNWITNNHLNNSMENLILYNIIARPNGVVIVDENLNIDLTNTSFIGYDIMERYGTTKFDNIIINAPNKKLDDITKAMMVIDENFVAPNKLIINGIVRGETDSIIWSDKIFRNWRNKHVNVTIEYAPGEFVRRNMFTI